MCVLRLSVDITQAGPSVTKLSTDRFDFCVDKNRCVGYKLTQQTGTTHNADKELRIMATAIERTEEIKARQAQLDRRVAKLKALAAKIKAEQEALKAEKTALRPLVKEEKDAIKIAEKAAEKARKDAEKAEKTAAKAAEKAQKKVTKAPAKPLVSKVKAPKKTNKQKMQEEDCSVWALAVAKAVRIELGQVVDVAMAA